VIRPFPSCLHIPTRSTSKPERRLVVVNGYRGNGTEVIRSAEIPSTVAVDVRLILSRAAFEIGEPEMPIIVQGLEGRLYGGDGLGGISGKTTMKS